MIASGRVAVDGQTVTELGTRVDPEKVSIAVDGTPIGRTAEKVYLLLNKPPGYTTTRSDPYARHTVVELVLDFGYLFPVGRLDQDTSGLLIMTNDGDFANLLTHPSHEVEKTYVAEVRGVVDAREISRLEQGVELDDGVTAPAKARVISCSPGEGKSVMEITIHEGRKRQIKRMIDRVGHRVLKLRRIRIGPLELGSLREGEYRHLTPREVSRLKRHARHPGHTKL